MLTGCVLLVEDHAFVQVDIEQTLLGLGARTVIFATSVDQAVRYLETETLELAICEWRLGPDNCARVLRAARSAGVAYIVASGVDVEDMDQSLVENVIVLNKPYSTDALEKAVCRVVSQTEGEKSESVNRNPPVSDKQTLSH